MGASPGGRRQVGPGRINGVAPERVELGVPCDECGGSGELPDGECSICFGEGTVSQFVTIGEFREGAGIATGPQLG